MNAYDRTANSVVYNNRTDYAALLSIRPLQNVNVLCFPQETLPSRASELT